MSKRCVLFPVDLWTRPAHIRLMAKHPRHMEWFMYVCSVAREALAEGLIETGDGPLSGEDLIVLPRNIATMEWLEDCLQANVIHEQDGCLFISNWSDFHRPPHSKSAEAERLRSQKRRRNDRPATEEARSEQKRPQQKTEEVRSNSEQPQDKTEKEVFDRIENRTPNLTYPNLTYPQPQPNADTPRPDTPQAKICRAMQKLEPGGPSPAVVAVVADYLSVAPASGIDPPDWLEMQLRAALEGIDEIANAPHSRKIQSKPRVSLQRARSKLGEWARHSPDNDTGGCRMLN